MPEETEVQILDTDGVRHKRTRITPETPSLISLQAQIKNLQKFIEIKDAENQQLSNRLMQKEQERQDAENRYLFLKTRNKAVMENFSMQLDAVRNSIDIELKTEVSHVG